MITLSWNRSTRSYELKKHMKGESLLRPGAPSLWAEPARGWQFEGAAFRLDVGGSREHVNCVMHSSTRETRRNL